MWFKYNRNMFTVLTFVLVYNACGATTSGEFNQQIRDFSVVNDNINLTNVKTLQKENLVTGRHASFSPLQNVVRFKEVPDNVLSGSSHGRGLHHDHTGLGVFGYEEPHGYGYELPHDNHYDPHDYHHHDIHDHYVGPHLGYGHHHKHYDHHGLAAKTFLWPIAGLALLGAAAALVSNPVLLQLGVVSGRKKRHTDNVDIVTESIKKWSATAETKRDKRVLSEKSVPAFIVKRRFIKNVVHKIKPTEPTSDVIQLDPNFEILTELQKYSDVDSDGMIPVPLKIKNP